MVRMPTWMHSFRNNEWKKVCHHPCFHRHNLGSNRIEEVWKHPHVSAKRIYNTSHTRTLCDPDHFNATIKSCGNIPKQPWRCIENHYTYGKIPHYVSRSWHHLHRATSYESLCRRRDAFSHTLRTRISHRTSYFWEFIWKFTISRREYSNIWKSEPSMTGSASRE